MKHIQPEMMQRFLADELDLMTREALTEHLAECDACAALLVQMTADDDTLAQALRLDDDEAAWISSIDLTAPVLEKIRPWYREPVVVAALIPMVVIGAYMLKSFTSLIYAHTVAPEGPVEILRTLAVGLWQLNLYLGQGGLLRSLWPVLIVACAAWLWTVRTKKESKDHA